VGPSATYVDQIQIQTGTHTVKDMHCMVQQQYHVAWIAAAKSPIRISTIC